MRRGEALWINVARAVHWLQPTDILPRLVFPGGASDELQARVRQDLESTLAFYRDQYGIQVAPSYTVYVPRDIESLLTAFENDGIEVDDHLEASHRSLWDSSAAAWGGSTRVTLKQSLWESYVEGQTVNPRYILTHEYTHALHGTLAEGASVAWLREGTAHWASNAHRIADPSGWGPSRGILTTFAPTLRRAETNVVGWEYTLGWSATDLLTAEHGQDSWLEFYRRIISTQIGPKGQWHSPPSWHAAFQDTFGLTVPEFYAEFNAWRIAEVLANADRVSPDDAVAQWVSGSVTDASGSPVGGIEVRARRVEGGIDVGWLLYTGTTADGTFALGVHQNGDHRLTMIINGDCTRYYSNGTLIEEQDDASLVNVAGAEVANIDIRLPPNVCGWQIGGRAVGQDGAPLAGLSVSACPVGAGECTQGDRTALDGSFEVAVKEAGDYRLRLDLTDGCGAYFRKPPGVALSSDDASPITVAGANVDGLIVRVPHDVCAYQIMGSVIKTDGEPLTDSYISACREVDGRCVERVGSRTDTDGSFAITVPADGRYRVSFTLDGCTIYFRAGGFTTTVSERSTARVAGRDARLNPRQIPAEMCAHVISGRLLKADGTPFANGWMNAFRQGDTVGTGVATDANGRFEVRVPADGAYRFSIQLRESPICWYSLAGQAIGSRDNPVQVSGADASGVTLRLPGTIEELCR